MKKYRGNGGRVSEPAPVYGGFEANGQRAQPMVNRTKIPNEWGIFP
jgi:hypothetical protein